jgi:hypothetical protein
MPRFVFLVLALIGVPALACEYPDEGTTPLHRAVKKIELVPEIDEWVRKSRDSGSVVQFTVLLDRPVEVKSRCYWTVEVASGGKLWQRFLVSPDGKNLRAEVEGRAISIAEWRRTQR